MSTSCVSVRTPVVVIKSDIIESVCDVCVCTEQTVVDELSPKCLELRVGRLLAFNSVCITHTHTQAHTQTHTHTQTDRQAETLSR